MGRLIRTIILSLLMLNVLAGVINAIITFTQGGMVVGIVNFFVFASFVLVFIKIYLMPAFLSYFAFAVAALFANAISVGVDDLIHKGYIIHSTYMDRVFAKTLQSMIPGAVDIAGRNIWTSLLDGASLFFGMFF